MSRAKRIRLSVWGLLIVPALACVFLMAVRPYLSQDVWHHIRCGWYALPTNHGPATTEPFTFFGRLWKLPWIQYEWLAQILIYLGHTRLGPPGAILAKAALYAAAFGLLALAARRRGACAEATALAVVVGAFACAVRFWVRPEVFSFLLFAFVVWALERARDGKLWTICLLPPAFALWANLHGAYVAGWVLIALAAAGPWLWIVVRWVRPRLERRPAFPRWSRGEAPEGRAAVWLAAAFVACVVAVCANPYGVRILTTPFELTRSALVRQAVMEWKPATLDVWLSKESVFLPLLVVGLCVGARRLRLADVLFLVAFGYLATTARRHLYLLAFLVVPILADLWTPAFERLRRTRWPTWATQTLLLLLFAFATAFALGPRSDPRARLGFTLDRFGLGVSREYPTQCAQYLLEQKLTGNLYNDYWDGNYFIWALNRPWNDVYAKWNADPPYLVFVDGRIDVFGEKVMRLYDRVRRAEPGWKDVLGKYGVNVCVTSLMPRVRRKGRDEAAALTRALWEDPDWALVFWDDKRVIFARGPARRGRPAFHIRPDTFAPEEIGAEKAWRAAVAEMRRRVDMGPKYGCATARSYLGDLLMARGRLRGAADEYRRALALDPRASRVYYHYGVAMLRARDTDRAVRAFRRCLRTDPEDPALPWNALASARLQAGEWREAVRCAREALRLKPKYALPYLNLSVAYEKLGRPGESLRAAEEALRLAPENRAAQQRVRRLKSAGSSRD